MCAPQQLATEQYTVELYHLYSCGYLPLHIVTSTWILALAKLLCKVPFTSTLAKHLHILIWSYIFQCQHTIGCYLVFQITIGGKEIPTRGNTISDYSGSGTSEWMSPTLCTMISLVDRISLTLPQQNMDQYRCAMDKINKENNLMLLRTCRYHILQLAEELAAATNRQLTLAERNNVLNYEDYLSEWMPMYDIAYLGSMWCVCIMSKVKLIMLVPLVFNMQCMHIFGIV